MLSGRCSTSLQVFYKMAFHCPIFTYSHSGTPSASSSLDSLHPSESASQISHQPSYSWPSSRLSGRRRNSHIQADVPGELVVPVCSAACVKMYEQRILHLTASAGFPLSWVENPEFQALQEEFMPGSPHISQKVLMKRILPSVVAEFRETVKWHTTGKEATMQSDGWTRINNHHLVAFMITVDNKVRVWRMLDTSNGPDITSFVGPYCRCS